MKIPTSQELLGIQNQLDADLFKKEYPEWAELNQDHPLKKPILDELKHGGIITAYLAAIFIFIVILIVVSIIFTI